MVLPESIVLAEVYDAALLDLDGVVYVGKSEVAHAASSINAARAAGMRIGYVTNNASRPPAAVRDHLAEFGLDPALADIVTSAQIAADVLASRFAPGALILVVGGRGLVEAVSAVGLVPVTQFADDPVAVVQGFGPDTSWRSLSEAAYAVHAGVPWVATNADLTVPTAQGIAPGNGALIQTVAIATGAYPEVVGKPEPVVFAAAAARLGSSRPVVVGDRLDTDIQGAVAAGMPSLLVLTGVTDLAAAFTAPPQARPTFVAPDLRWLLRPLTLAHPVDGGFRAADSIAEIERGRIRLVVGTDPVCALQALLALVWSQTDAGQSVEMGDPLVALGSALAGSAR